MAYIGLLIAAALVGIDQLTKWLVYSNMTLLQSINLISFGDTEVLNISYYTNDGSAFSMFEGQTTMLVIVTSVAIIALIAAILLKKVKRTPYIIAFSMIIGGGIGNLIDRLFNSGNVVDFIDFRLIHFAIFNFADICAVCGGILVVLLVILDEVKESRKKRAEAADSTAEVVSADAEQPSDSDEPTNDNGNN